MKLDYTMSAVVGLAGLQPTIDVVKISKTVAIANKETIVCGWEILSKLKKHQKNIYFIGRRASATPATGSYERHLSNQKNIIRLALNAKIDEIKALWEGVSLRQYKLPIE